MTGGRGRQEPIPTPRQSKPLRTPRQTNQQRSDPEPGRFRSNNPRMGKFINFSSKYCAIKHHQKNWKTLPRNLEKNIEQFFEQIHLPCPKPTTISIFDNAMARVKEDIRNTAQKYLEEAAEAQRIMITELNVDEWDEAKPLVLRQLKRNQGLKFREQDAKNDYQELQRRSQRTQITVTAEIHALHPSTHATMPSNNVSHPRRNLDTQLMETESIIEVIQDDLPTQTPNRKRGHAGSPLTSQDRITKVRHLNPRTDPDVEPSSDEEGDTPLEPLPEKVGTEIIHINGQDSLPTSPHQSPPSTQETTNNLAQGRPSPNLLTTITQTLRTTTTPTIEDKTALHLYNKDTSSPVILTDSPIDPDNLLGSTQEDRAKIILQPIMTRSSTPTEDNNGKQNIPSERETNNKPIIQSDPKSGWHIGNLRPETKTLLIGDTGIRGLDCMPSYIETHVLLGANLEHTATVLDKMSKQKNLKNIIIQVGANNKNWQQRNTVTHINRIINASKKLEAKLTFVGIPAPREMKDNERLTINHINAYAKDKVETYIEPLNEVCTRAGGIYDKGTLKFLSEKIINFLEKAMAEQVPK